MKTISKTVFALALCGGAWISTASAIDLGQGVQLHGYGHAGYLVSENNDFLKADSAGTWDYHDIALLLTDDISERSKAWVQLYQIYGEHRVDWAFVDYTFSNNSTLKLGQIKLPFGLYNDFRDVEYTRPSTLKPFLYQDVTEMVAEAYRGVGYNFQLGEVLSVDLYAGKIVDFEDGEEEFKRLWGGRLSYTTSVPGLSFMVSAFQSGVEEAGETGTINTTAFSVDYHPEKVDLKFEIARKRVFTETLESYYGQLAYTFAESWTPFVRYDYIATDKAESSDPSFYQQAVAVGLGYRINDNFSARLEHHFIKGYGLAVASEEVEVGEGEENWSMTAFSLNFIF